MITSAIAAFSSPYVISYGIVILIVIEIEIPAVTALVLEVTVLLQFDLVEVHRVVAVDRSHLRHGALAAGILHLVDQHERGRENIVEFVGNPVGNPEPAAYAENILAVRQCRKLLVAVALVAESFAVHRKRTFGRQETSLHTEIEHPLRTENGVEFVPPVVVGDAYRSLLAHGHYRNELRAMSLSEVSAM